MPRASAVHHTEAGRPSSSCNVEGMIGGVGRGNGVAAGKMPLFEPLSPVPDARTLPTFIAVKL
jgi:hypothetical protein